MERSEKKEPRLKVFQERFELLRKGRDLSNTEFAKFLDMSRQTVGFYLNGDRVPDALMLRQIAEKCNVSADWLLGLSDAKPLAADVKQICNYTGLKPDSVDTLHKLNTTWNKPTFALILIDEILHLDRIYRVGKTAWRGAMAEAQIRKIAIRHAQERECEKPIEMPWSEYFQTEEYKEKMQKTLEETRKSDEKMAEEACKPISEVSERIEIGAFDAAKLFKDRAISPLKIAIENAYRRYIDEITKITFGDEYEKYLQNINMKAPQRRKENRVKK